MRTILSYFPAPLWQKFSICSDTEASVLHPSWTINKNFSPLILTDWKAFLPENLQLFWLGHAQEKRRFSLVEVMARIQRIKSIAKHF
jgi:hypothetical protein